MNTRLHQHYRILCVALLLLAVLASGCAKKPVAQPPAPAPAPPPPASPTVTLQAAPTSIQKGESATLTWSSTNATQLTLEPGLGTVAPEGSSKATPAESTTYTITATGPGGNADATARVTVAQPPPPPTAPQPTIEELFLREVQDTYFDYNKDRKSTRLNSSHIQKSRMPSSA